MPHFHNKIVIEAPVEKVWRALADLEAVRHYNPLVAQVRLTSSQKEGVGAGRHCDFKPRGWAKERVTGWEPMKALSIEMYESAWPVHFARWRTALQAQGPRTLVSQELEYEPKGVLGHVMNTLMMRRQWPKVIDNLFSGLKRYVEENRDDGGRLK